MKKHHNAKKDGRKNKNSPLRRDAVILISVLLLSLGPGDSLRINLTLPRGDGALYCEINRDAGTEKEPAPAQNTPAHGPSPQT